MPRIISMHEFIREIKKDFEEYYDLLCLIAKDIYGDGGRFAIVKLLEEYYSLSNIYSHVSEWRLGSCRSIGRIILHGNGFVESPQLSNQARIDFINTMLSRPDRLLVLPDC